MARSWFQLTLWHGTPEELTSELSITVNCTDQLLMNVRNQDSIDCNIGNATTTGIAVQDTDGVSVIVEDLLEVNANVGV